MGTNHIAETVKNIQATHRFYTEDPDRNVVEFAVLTRPFTEEDAKQALEPLRATSPPPAAAKPRIQLHKADATA